MRWMPSTKLMRSLLSGVAFALAFVVNPAYVAGCVSVEDEEPDFGEPEMLDLLDSVHAMGPYSFKDGAASYEVELALEQVAGEDAVSAAARPWFASQAHACGSRTFMNSAAACETITELAVEGSLTLRRTDGEGSEVVAEDLPIEGRVVVYGNRLSNARVELSFEDGNLSLRSADGKTVTFEAFETQSLGEDDLEISADPPVTIGVEGNEGGY